MSQEIPEQKDKILGTVESDGVMPIYDRTKRVNQYADVVRFNGVVYDCRMEENGLGYYRLTSEDYFSSPNPAYITINKSGEVIEARTIRGTDWTLFEKKNNENE